MTVIIRKIDTTENQFIAYAKSLCGKATYFVYFQDSIWGAVALHNFVEMLRVFFHLQNVEVTLSENDLEIKNDLVLQLIRE